VSTSEVATGESSSDDVIVAQDSKFLGDNLRTSGRRSPGEGYGAHHIAPSRAGDERMDELRARLDDLKLDLNDAANGVWLPGSNAAEDATGAYHPSLNNKQYNTAIIDAFKDVTTRDQAIDVLKRIAEKLLEGKFPGVRPRGG
jgi:hypothetical protein